MNHLPKVALVIETSLSVGRGILAGVRNYIRKQGPWSIYAYPQGLGQDLPNWFKDWQGDGIIARFQNERIRDAVRVFLLKLLNRLIISSESYRA